MLRGRTTVRPWHLETLRASLASLVAPWGSYILSAVKIIYYASFFFLFLSEFPGPILLLLIMTPFSKNSSDYFAYLKFVFFSIVNKTD